MPPDGPDANQHEIFFALGCLADDDAIDTINMDELYENISDAIWLDSNNVLKSCPDHGLVLHLAGKALLPKLKEKFGNDLKKETELNETIPEFVTPLLLLADRTKPNYMPAIESTSLGQGSDPRLLKGTRFYHEVFLRWEATRLTTKLLNTLIDERDPPSPLYRPT